MSMMILALLVAGAEVAPSVEQAPPVETRTVAVELREGDRVVASPSVMVELGRPAALAIEDYGLSLVVDRSGEHYFVSSGLYRTEGNGWTLLAQPSLTVDDNAPARLTFTGADGTALSLEVEIR